MVDGNLGREKRVSSKVGRRERKKGEKGERRIGDPLMGFQKYQFLFQN